MIITQSRVLFQLLLWYCRPWVTPLYISGHNCSSENSCFWGCNGYLQFFVCAASIPLFFSNQIPFREFPSLVECAILKGLPCPWLGDDHMTRAWPITCSFLVIWLLKSGLCKTKADNNLNYFYTFFSFPDKCPLWTQAFRRHTTSLRTLKGNFLF